MNDEQPNKPDGKGREALGPLRDKLSKLSFDAMLCRAALMDAYNSGLPCNESEVEEIAQLEEELQRLAPKVNHIWRRVCNLINPPQPDNADWWKE